MSKFVSQLVQAIIDWWKRTWFEARLTARMDMVELQNRIEADLEREQQARPIYIEHPINTDQQTGESKLLGGPMELKAPWYNESNES